MVILDHGASVTDTQLQIAKDAAQVILSAIDEHDKVTMIPVPHMALDLPRAPFLKHSVFYDIHFLSPSLK